MQGAGIYMIQARIHGNDASPTNNTVSYVMNLIVNSATWGSTAGDIIYGIYTPLNVYTPLEQKQEARLLLTLN